MQICFTMKILSLDTPVSSYSHIMHMRSLTFKEKKVTSVFFDVTCHAAIVMDKEDCLPAGRLSDLSSLYSNN